MYEQKPYRPCPICRNGLTVTMSKYKEQGHVWDVYECSNCGSEIWIIPFKRVVEGKK